MASKVISTILNLKDNFSKTLENTTKNTRSFQNQIQHTQNTVNSFRDKAVGAFKTISAGAGISLGGGFTAGVIAGNDLNNTLIKMKNTTGFTGKALSDMRNSMLSIYKDGYGEDFNEIADTIKAIGQQGTYSSDKLKEIAEDALLIKNNFGFEVNESFRSAKMMMDQFGISADTAYSLIAQGAQYGLDKNGDLLDTINEYSVHFKQLGFNSEEMFNMLNNGAKSGTFSVDKLGDAIKEFGIRTKDGSDGTMTAFQQLGLDANSISAEFAKGGADGKKAFIDVTNALNNMKDPLQQNQIGVALFGTMWEDLGKDGIKALTDTNGELISTDDALKKIKANDMQSLTMSFKKIKNSIVADVLLPLGTNLQPTIDKVIEHLKGAPQAINDTFVVVGSVLNKTKPIFEWMIQHSQLVKASLVGLGAGVGAVGLVNKILKIKNALADAKKAISELEAGASNSKKIGTIFQSIFKMPPQALIFIAGVALIAGLAYIIIKNWTPISNFFKKTFGNIKNSLSSMWNGIKTAAILISASFKNTFNSVYNWLKGFFGKWGTTILAVLVPFIGIPLLIYQHWGQISAWFKKIGSDIAFSFNQTVLWFEGLPGRFWNSAVNTFEWFKNGAWSIISGIGAWIKEKFTAFINFFKNLPATLLQAGKDIIEQLKQGIMSKVDSVVQTAKDLGNKILKGIKSIFGINSPSTEMFSIGGYLIQGLENAIFKGKSTLQSVISTVFGGAMDFAKGIIGGGDISGWLTQALVLTGTPMSWLQGLLKLTSYESGDPGKLGTGNAGLVNSVPVGNEYATGLLQMLPSTFREFAVNGLGGITNPIANAVAAIRYIKSRYGSIYNTPLFTSGGTYMGYASGTDNAKEGIAELAENGMELVIGRQARRLKGGEQVLNNKDTVSLLKGRGNKTVNVYVIIQGNVIGNEEFKEEVGEYVGARVLEDLNNM